MQYRRLGTTNLDLSVIGLGTMTFGEQTSESEAIKQMDWMLENYHMEFDWLKGFSYLWRGKSYDALDKRDLAIYDYKEVLRMDKYYPEVEEAMRRIKEIGESNKE